MARTYNNLDEFENALRTAYSGLDAIVDNALKAHSNTLADSIKLRVTTRGEKSTGEAFSSPYSRSHANKRKKYGNGYLGQQTAYKGFYYQGTMWDNFKVLIKGNKRVSLGFVGSNTYLSNDNLAQIHSAKERISIIAPSNDEALQLTRNIGKSIGDYLKSVLA